MSALNNVLPTVLANLVSKFSDQTPAKGDRFVIYQGCEDLVTESTQASYTVTEAFRKLSQGQYTYHVRLEDKTETIHRVYDVESSGHVCGYPMVLMHVGTGILPYRLDRE